MRPHAKLTALAMAIALTFACRSDETDDEPALDDESSEGSDGGETSSGGEPAELDCVAACEVHDACDVEPIEACVSVCETMYDAYALFDADCQQHFADLSACVSVLECGDYRRYDEPTLADRPCAGPATELDACGSPVCQSYCATAVACGTEQDVAQCERNCRGSIVGGAFRGEFCVSAKHERFACAAALECDALRMWNEGSANACAEYDVAEAAVCTER